MRRCALKIKNTKTSVIYQKNMQACTEHNSKRANKSTTGS